MLLQSKTGEIFQVLEGSAGSPYFEELPDNRAILVKQFKEARGLDGSLIFEIEIRRFVKGALNIISSDSIHPITLFNKEDVMSNSQNLIDGANKAGIDGLKIVYRDLSKKMLERAIRVAEAQNEFQAMSLISEFVESLGFPKASATSVTPIDGKTVELTKEKEVTDRLWQMILGKVDKIGSVTVVKGNSATLILKKGKDSDNFIKSVSTIKGIKIA